MYFGLYLINKASHNKSKKKVNLFAPKDNVLYVPFPARKITASHNETSGWIVFDILNEHLARAWWSWYEHQILHIIKSGIIEDLFDLLQSIGKLGFQLYRIASS